ncbi:hypothetical protein [Streptantibioticus ferralitis]|uniref:Uncharacterized protein n=1 Tax=Streptantibioticus ferralitis TaxID=236510 RepID=A0ABT5Z0Q3_9ACTN|nr:hypothetical protein [Streptantibioticus ferralitis]MDF2257423.1 hypothetical protein [Streptantibioticus ferralitis]
MSTATDIFEEGNGSGMTDTSQSLIVPVEVAALAVTGQMTVSSMFRRWVPKFFKRKPRQSPEPDPSAASDLGQPQDRGVYLHWLLPPALVRGRVDLSTGQGTEADIAFPTIPNRWLVVRHFRPTAESGKPLPKAAGWLIRSDFLDPRKGTSPYLHNGESTKIGASIDLENGSWSEPLAPRPQFLTAAGPGLPDFTSFQPYNANVLSFHDQLPDGLIDTAGTISYLVAGWYSDADEDPLCARQIEKLLTFRGEAAHHTTEQSRFEAALHALGWRCADGTRAVHRSLYVGTTLGLAWQVDATPDSDLPMFPMRDMRVAVGNGATDARTALLEETATPRDRLLLEAFEYGVLDELDDALVDGGRDILDAAAHRTWFSPTPAGFTWQIVDCPPAHGEQEPARKPRPDEEVMAERAWLARLNRDQRAFDDAMRDLAALRGRLYGLWWSSGLEAAPDDFRTDCATQLDPARDGLAKRVKSQWEACFGADGARAKIPYGDTPSALRASIEEYREQHKLSTGRPLAADRELKRVPAAPYQRPTDPVVLINGPGARMEPPRTTPLDCRTPAQLLAGVALEEGIPTTPSRIPPAPAHLADVTGALPWAPMADVLAEFAVLEEAARLVWPSGSPEQRPRGPLDQISYQGKSLRIHDRAGKDGVWPEFTELWRQPWRPLYLLWQVSCHPLPYLTGSEESAVANWTFDGRRHRWSGTGNLKDQSIRGRARLSPLPGFALRGRVEEYINRYGDEYADTLRRQADSEQNRNQISQTLDGINAWLAQRVPAHHFDPLDGPGRTLLATEPVVPNPAVDEELRHFDPVRSAQLIFADLTLVDQFGQTCRLVNPNVPAERRLLRAPSVTPDPDPDHPDEPLVANASEAGYRDRFVQLPPRLHQPARTRLEWLSGRDDDHPVSVDALPVDPDHTPVCGWLVPNAREGTLLVYGGKGEGLGELHIAGEQGKERVEWIPLPGSPWLTRQTVLADSDTFTTAHPHLGGLVRELLEEPPKPVDPTPAALTRGPAAFRDLLAVIDRALHAIAPAAQHTEPHWSLLVGRPLALVRARVRIELAGPPAPAPTWSRLLSGPLADDGNPLRSIRWPVRLGDPFRAGDGLVGYFTADPAASTAKSTPYHRMYTAYRPPRPESTYPLPIDAAADPRVLAAHTPDSSAPASANAAAWLTLLVDPWATVHAHTGILPVISAALPEPYVRGPLSSLTPSLRTGPLLASVVPGTAVPGATAPSDPTVALPRSTAWQATWSWSERSAAGTGTGSWSELALSNTSTGVHPPQSVPVARTGFLTLTPDPRGKTS